jgi:hypothetical protein
MLVSSDGMNIASARLASTQRGDLTASVIGSCGLTTDARDMPQA